MDYSDINIWHVYLCPNCKYAIPDPKTKYIVVVAKDSGSIFGCFINSQRSDFVENRPYLHPCEADIPVKTHTFLNHDSIIDCHDVYSFTATDLTRLLGTIDSSTKETLLQAVADCPVIKIKRKKLIYSQSGLTYVSD